MATLDDVAQLAADLPQSAEGDRNGTRTWSVAGKTFAWERLFSKADIKRFGTTPIPSQPIVAFRVADQTDKEAVLAQRHSGVFTIEHFNGFNAVLVELADVEPNVLAELVEDAWLAMAPPHLAESWRAAT
jgi:hypothetical protein